MQLIALLQPNLTNLLQQTAIASLYPSMLQEFRKTMEGQ